MATTASRSRARLSTRAGAASNATVFFAAEPLQLGRVPLLEVGTVLAISQIFAARASRLLDWTSQPLAASARHTWLPLNPEPPNTATRGGAAAAAVCRWVARTTSGVSAALAVAARALARGMSVEEEGAPEAAAAAAAEELAPAEDLAQKLDPDAEPPVDVSSGADGEAAQGEAADAEGEA